MLDLAAEPAARPSLIERVDPAMMLLATWSVLAAASLLAGGGAGHLAADDAMRLVEVRDFMAGQAWGDTVQPRLAPPEGVAMHWSRLVDAPLAALMLVLQPLLGQALAETVAATAWPLGLLAVLAALVMKAADSLAGRTGALLALALLALSGPSLVHFKPGAIDHHNVQLVLTLAMTVCAMRAQSSARAAALAGGLAALSLAVGLEMLPAVAVTGAAMGVASVALGAPFSRPATSFGFGLALTALAVRLVTPGPALLGPVVCDAFGAPVLALCTLGGGALLACAALSRRLPGLGARLACGALLGAAAACAFAAAYPECLRAPYGHLDPRLAVLWLDTVAESQPMLDAISASPEIIAPIFAFVALSLCLGCAWAVKARAPAFRESDETRFALLLLLAVTVAHLATGVWQTRGLIGAVVTSTPLLAACLAAAFRARGPRAEPAMLLLCLCLSPACLAAVGTASAGALSALAPSKAPEESVMDLPTCSSAADLAALGELDRGRVMAGIDLGPGILAETPHAVFAAPYHRNIAGNTALLDTMLATPEAAARTLGAVGADYLALCPGSLDEKRYSGLAPEGLAARLARGEAMPFLAPVAMPAGSLKVWRVVGR
jgi:hypothetical protein